MENQAQTSQSPIVEAEPPLPPPPPPVENPSTRRTTRRTTTRLLRENQNGIYHSFSLSIFQLPLFYRQSSTCRTSSENSLCNTLFHSISCINQSRRHHQQHSQIHYSSTHHTFHFRIELSFTMVINRQIFSVHISCLFYSSLN